MRSADDLIQALKGMASPPDREGMARFGINTERALGISVTTLRTVAKEVGRDHILAGELWDSGIHEARLLATLVDDPKAVTGEQMEAWAADFDSWDLCDQCCMNLFWRTPYATEKAYEWAGREEEFVKRAAFALMARLATKRAKSTDELLESFLPIIERSADDGPELRAQGRELGASSDRQEQPAPERSGHPERRAHQGSGHQERALDRQRRAARAHLRQGAGAPLSTTPL